MYPIYYGPHRGTPFFDFDVCRSRLEHVITELIAGVWEKGFEYGVKTRLDVDDAQMNLTRTRAKRAKASRNCLVARVTMKWATRTMAE